MLKGTRFVRQHDEEMSTLKKERRPGRPASTREDILRIKIAADEKEDRDGFCEWLSSAFWVSY
jgi:translation machinery-associated protein 16